LIPFGSGRLAGGPDRREVYAIRHHNNVFHGVLPAVPWDVFDRLVAEHDSDRRVRGLTTKSQFVALRYGQLAGLESLRAIVAGLESQTSRL
jgi:hypothetical protein